MRVTNGGEEASCNQPTGYDSRGRRTWCQESKRAINYAQDGIPCPPGLAHRTIGKGSGGSRERAFRPRRNPHLARTGPQNCVKQGWNSPQDSYLFLLLADLTHRLKKAAIFEP